MNIKKILKNFVIIFLFFDLNSMGVEICENPIQTSEANLMNEARKILARLNNNYKSLFFYETEKPSDQLLTVIAQKCSDLKSIYLYGSNRNISNYFNPVTFTDLGVMAIATCCKNLESISLSSCWQITDRAFKLLAQNCKNLQNISFSNCLQLTDDAVFAFAQNCQFLQKVDFSYCDKITDQSIIELIKNNHHCYYINKDYFATLSSILKEINLNNCVQITDKAIKEIAYNCRFLEFLHLSGCNQITDEAIKELLFCCPNLRRLYIYERNNISDLLIQKFHEHPNLQVFY